MERFLHPSNEYIKELLDSKDSKNTKRVTEGAVRCFRQFLIEAGKDPTFETFEAKDLDAELRAFYAGARKQDGQPFKKSALVSVRFGLKRFLKDKQGIDITTDTSFLGSNDVFRAVVTDLKRKGLGNVVHHTPISDGDMARLYSGESHVFDIDTPFGLQRKVWFELSLYLCRRGRENLRDMTKDTFQTKNDDQGNEYIFQHTDELDKNHREDSTDLPTEGRIYEQKGSRHCPVLSFKRYLSKLNPGLGCLWQKPRDSFCDADATWYCASPVGKNTLGCMMVNICKTAKLSGTYTNHSVRATSITIMDRAGIKDRQIMQISGHKSETSLKHYAQHVSDTQKREISNTVNRALISQNHPSQKSKPVADLDGVNLSELFCDFNAVGNQAVALKNDSKEISMTAGAGFNFTPMFSPHCNVTINVHNYQRQSEQ